MPPKRKRAATAPKEAAPEAVQPSSRDASGEDTADPILDDVKERKSMDPPTKRTRSAKTEETNGTKQTDAKGRPRAASKVEMPADGAAQGGGENGEAGTLRMAAPPKAGTVDPVGYKTNPPPKGRPVRVYADGVFAVSYTHLTLPTKRIV